MEPELCEYCGERPGVKNSSYWRLKPDDAEGGWVCEVCEQELEAEIEELRRDLSVPYLDPKAD
jgi:transcription elongation factor Elf1